MKFPGPTAPEGDNSYRTSACWGVLTNIKLQCGFGARIWKSKKKVIVF